MNADQPVGSTDMAYGAEETHNLRTWKVKPSKAPVVIIFIHVGSWCIGTNLDSIGSTKIPHLTRQGYTFASVNYTLLPTVSVKE